MSEPLVDPAVPNASVAAPPDAVEVVGCPPPADRPAEPAVDPRSQLLRMAAHLARTRSDRLLVEYLRLRRAAC